MAINAKPFLRDINLRGNQILEASAERLAADPVLLYAGRFWYNTTENRMKYYDGTSVKSVATVSDVTSINDYQGTHDASTGNAPTTTLDGSPIVAGDAWLVTTGGTIVGVTPNPVLANGDYLYAKVDGAVNGSDFASVEGNQGATGAAISTYETTVALVAGVPFTVTATGLSAILSVQVWDTATNPEIEIAPPSGNTVDLCASESIAVLTVKIIGLL